MPKDETLDKDVQSIEKEIDSKVDNLFVNLEDTESTPEHEGKEHSPQSDEELELLDELELIEETEGEDEEEVSLETAEEGEDLALSMDVDFQTFEDEIDTKVDNLFADSEDAKASPEVEDKEDISLESSEALELDEELELTDPIEDDDDEISFEDSDELELMDVVEDADEDKMALEDDAGFELTEKEDDSIDDLDVDLQGLDEEINSKVDTLFAAEEDIEPSPEADDEGEISLEIDEELDLTDTAVIPKEKAFSSEGDDEVELAEEEDDFIDTLEQDFQTLEQEIDSKVDNLLKAEEGAEISVKTDDDEEISLEDGEKLELAEMTESAEEDEISHEGVEELELTETMEDTGEEKLPSLTEEERSPKADEKEEKDETFESDRKEEEVSLQTEEEKEVVPVIGEEEELSQEVENAEEEDEEEIHHEDAVERDELGKIKEYLLTLDWEIKGETFQKFFEEVSRLEEKYGDHASMVAVLQFMKKALDQIMEPGSEVGKETIISFLNNAKEALHRIVHPQKDQIITPEKIAAGIEEQFERLATYPEKKLEETTTEGASQEIREEEEIERAIEEVFQPAEQPLETVKSSAEMDVALPESKVEEVSEFDQYRKTLLDQSEQFKGMIKRFHISEEFLGHKNLFNKFGQDLQALSSEFIDFQKEFHDNIARLNLLLQTKGEKAKTERQKKELFFVSVSNNIFAIPADSVEAIFRISQQYIPLVSHQKEITLKEKVFPLIPLGEKMGLQKSMTMLPKEEKILLVRSDKGSIPILLDMLLTKQEAEISFMEQEEGKEIFSGKAIVPKAVPVIDTHRL